MQETNDHPTTCDYAAIFVSQIFSCLVSARDNSSNDDTAVPAATTQMIIQSTVWIGLGVSILTWIVSTYTDNYSQVDKLWSILPPVYALILGVTPRGRLMSCLAIVWGVRLTANFHRRGGYVFPNVWNGEEDYRWSYVRKGYSMIPYLTIPWVWHLSNALFISLYQNILLWWIAMPSMIVYIDETMCHGDTRLTYIDWCLGFIFIALVIVETIADNQQYTFQTEKYQRRAEQGKNNNDPLSLIRGHYRDGFCQTGLLHSFANPTYYAFSVKLLSTDTHYHQYQYRRLFNWSFLGWIQLIFLFQLSSWLTEKITKGKYPAFVQYQKQTPLFVPYLWRRYRGKQKE